MQHFTMKSEVIFKKGSLDYLKTLQHKRALVITDPFMVEHGFANQLINILKTSVPDYEVFSNIKPDPPIEIVAEGMELLMDYQPDVVIALGGGSTIDVAKSIILFASRLESGKIKPKLIAIPTTSGTGSEVTAYSVVTVDNQKIALVDEKIIPEVAIIDPSLVESVPPQITADTAIDALTHALEAYVSIEASDYTDGLAEKAIRLIFQHLLDAYKNGTNTEAREKVHNASCIAGMAFTNASLGINHSLAHALGGGFHIPHGRANAILLPYVIRYNAHLESKEETEAARRYAELASLINLPSSTTTEGVENLICAIEVLLQETNTPSHLQEMDVNERDFLSKVEEMSAIALEDKCTVTNPRRPKKEELVTIYKQAYAF